MKSDWAMRLKWRLMASLAIFLAVVVAATSAAVSTTVGRAVNADSEALTTDIGGVVRVCLSELMLTRDPERIAHVVDTLATSRDTIEDSFILDRGGTIRYSTRAGEVGRTLNRRTEASCIVCHRSDAAPDTHTHLIQQGGQTYLRNVTVFANGPECQACHGTENRINGKVVIDRSTAGTDRLLASIRSIVIGAGAFSLLALAVSIPAVGRGINRYVREIGVQESEITVLYTMVEHLSKSIEPRSLRAIMLRTALTTFDADAVLMMFADEAADRQSYRLRRGDAMESRVGVDADPRVREAFDRWIADELPDAVPAVAEGPIAVPLSQDGVRLGLILIRRQSGPLDAQTMRLLGALARHASVALQNAKLYAMAVSDSLTKLYTSRHFRTCLDASMDRHTRQQEPFGLLFLDIDNFKSINDTFGHVMGDEVLRRVAAAMAESIREQDLAFRYGGEELTALLPGAGTREGMAIAEAVRRSVEQLRAPGWPAALRVTASIGVAVCPGDAVTARALIERADAALYEAKRTGKNRVSSAGHMS